MRHRPAACKYGTKTDQDIDRSELKRSLLKQLSDDINKFSSFIIGAGTLPIRCAELLLDSGHEVCGIATTDLQLRRWADDRKVPAFAPGKDLATQIRKPFDYLFSIVNEHILQAEILRLPRKLAINYHDAPLPRYAGTHATSWALINREAAHGISWHEITELVDGGDILKQREIDISRDETALTLNTKCYEAAIDAFAELIADLSAGNVVRTKQDLEKRLFFPRFKRPAGGCVISWNSPAADISALVRALDFGPHPNPLGSAKIVINGRFFIVQEIDIVDLTTGTPPGTINEIDSDFIRVSTNDKDVLLRRLLHLDGRYISIAEFAATFDLHRGETLTSLAPEDQRRIDDRVAATCKYESNWIE
jgi:methionyl-tRNA formyltransferase